ncbi:phytase [Kribbella sp. NBC_00482]|uniref:phytase n=1 Tax=Kribbella sp. NBC_00482 TaxID=2975968 RepID=UPI002E18A718
MSTVRRSLLRPAALAAGLGLLAVPGLGTPASLAAGRPATTVAPVYAVSETPALYDDADGNNSNADDPAIWRDQTHPSRSLVIATAKEGGLRVYNLSGAVVQSLPAPAAPAPDAAPGRFNNVDLLTGVRFPDGRFDVAVVSDRGRDRIRTYKIDPAHPAAPLTDVTAASVPRVFAATEAEVDDQQTAYGVASFTDRQTGRMYAIASRRHTTSVGLVELKVVAGRINYVPVRTIDLPASFPLPNGGTWTPCEDPGATPQVEGMVVDARTGTLYAGQEDVGIWKISAHLTGTPVLLDRVRDYGVPSTYDDATETCVKGADPGFGGKHLTADVEGLTIYDDGHGGGYLLASSQGDNTFAAYDRRGPGRFLADFRIAPGASIDGSEECDGAGVSSGSFGPAFPHGLLVVQDGHNAPDVIGPDGEPRVNTNFKFVDWSDVAEATGLDD